MRTIVILICSTLLAISSADARSKRPSPGSVSCSCRCNIQKTDSGRGYSDLKFIGGYGQWDKTRADCQAFDGSRCEVEIDGKIYESRLSSCDTIVHSLPTDDTRTAPPAGEMAPEDRSGDKGTKMRDQILKHDLKIKRNTE